MIQVCRNLQKLKHEQKTNLRSHGDDDSTRFGGFKDIFFFEIYISLELEKDIPPVWLISFNCGASTTTQCQSFGYSQAPCMIHFARAKSTIARKKEWNWMCRWWFHRFFWNTFFNWGRWNYLDVYHFCWFSGRKKNSTKKWLSLRIHTLPDSSRFDGPNPILTLGL